MTPKTPTSSRKTPPSEILRIDNDEKCSCNQRQVVDMMRKMDGKLMEEIIKLQERQKSIMKIVSQTVNPTRKLEDS